MSSLSIAAILKTEALSNHLDHLAPLCSLFEAPLLVPEPSLHTLAKKYYPHLDVQLVDHWDLEPISLREKYELVIHSFFWRAGGLDLVNASSDKPLRGLYTPHGNSDKGHHSILMERFADQDITLLYGDHMKDFLSQKNTFDKLKFPVVMGNLRKRYYLKHKKFFDQIADEEVFSKFSKKRPIVLYAPTWNDEEDSSSFFQSLEAVCTQLPTSYNLIVKVHPYLFFHLPGHVLSWMGKYEKEGQVQFLVEFPLIYPLLEKTDVYLGDFSSVGYDFLTFDRPMVFLNLTQREIDDKSGFLHQCGVVLREIENVDLLQEIDMAMKMKTAFQTHRQKIADYAFSPVEDEALKKKLFSVLQK